MHFFDISIFDNFNLNDINIHIALKRGNKYWVVYKLKNCQTVIITILIQIYFFSFQDGI